MEREGTARPFRRGEKNQRPNCPSPSPSLFAVAMSSTADKKLHKPLPQLQNAAAVQPYLTAALSVLHTLENELRAAQLGSREEISADALALRSTELQTQIARLELETRSANLEHQLNESFGNLEKSKDGRSQKARAAEWQGGRADFRTPRQARGRRAR